MAATHTPSRGRGGRWPDQLRSAAGQNRRMVKVGAFRGEAVVFGRLEGRRDETIPE
jgi:hypothetical protein